MLALGWMLAGVRWTSELESAPTASRLGRPQSPWADGGSEFVILELM